MARTHVVMSDEVLGRIDRRVGARGRSRFVEEAALEKLARLELEETLHATKGIARGKGYEHWDDRDSTVAWVREARRADRMS
ncbi:MAG: hypothetical protein AB1551_07165 [Actinomycetota bacterium]